MLPTTPFRTTNGPLGRTIEGPGFIAHFGDRNATEDAIAHAFPNLRFRYLSQTHSSLVLQSRADAREAEARPEADAHWTADAGEALAIRTADCLPVLLVSAGASVVGAVHAGWRGVEGEILLKTSIALLEEGHAPMDLMAFVGPGIGPSSFEVGQDVAERLENSYRKVRFDQTDSVLSLHAEPEKRRVDLAKLASAQLLAAGLRRESIFSFSEDTFANVGFQSFRRDGERSGRQVSFVAKLPR